VFLKLKSKEQLIIELKVNVFTAKPGMVIGKGGQGVEDTKKRFEKMTNKNVAVNVIEVKVPEIDAQLSS
jgi:small subunit ribosomal protein S3